MQTSIDLAVTGTFTLLIRPPLASQRRCRTHRADFYLACRPLEAGKVDDN
jgi:hypothetical protein